MLDYYSRLEDFGSRVWVVSEVLGAVSEGRWRVSAVYRVFSVGLED